MPQANKKSRNLIRTQSFSFHIVQSILNKYDFSFYYTMVLYFIEEITIDKMKDILRIQKASSKIDIMKFSFYHRFFFLVFCPMNSFSLSLLLFAFFFSSLFSALYIQFFSLLFHPIKREQNT